MRKMRIVWPVASAVVLALIVGCTPVKQSASAQKNTQPSAANSGMTAASSNVSAGGTGAQQQTPAPAEKIPTGDIPDSQKFITFSSTAGGYRLEVPEGWARTTSGTNVTFVAKLDGLSVTETRQKSAPTVALLTNGPVKALERSGKAVAVHSLQSVTLKNGKVIKLVYDSNSEPDSVTGKRVRLENNTYFYYHNGVLAKLRMWAPLGADNVDQWLRIATSFTWSK